MRFDRSRLGQAFLVVSGAVCALLPAGCRSQINLTCDAMCDCTGCSEAKYLDCVDKATSSENEAAKKHCSAAFDTFISCVKDELECKDDKATYDGCNDEEQDLRKCGISVFRTPCELAAEMLAECKMGVPPSPSQQECSGAVACQATCQLNAGCDGLTGRDQMKLQEFSRCLMGCMGSVPTPQPSPGGGTEGGAAPR